jgi:nucleoside-diphosphate-sugar epimerase
MKQTVSEVETRMRALVLGGSTFVGRRLVQRLVERGDDVAVLNRGRTPAVLPESVRRLVADRTDATSMRAALDGTEWDAVFDVSGFVMVAGGSPIDELLELFEGRTGAYVFVSSIMAYEPTPLMPWTEDLPTSSEPTSSYGGFKAFAEAEVLNRFRVTGFPGSVARPAAIYGPDNNIHDMETAMFLRLRRKLPVLLPHGGLVTGNYGHVDDLCALLVAMALDPAVAGEVVNASGQAITTGGYVRALADIVGVEADIRMLPDAALAGAPKPLFGHLFSARHHAVISTEKARALNLPGERGFLEGHRQTYDWFCGTPLVDAPDALSDPVWGAGYDFALEAKVAAQL